VFTLLTGLGQSVSDPEARAILPLVGSTVGLLLALLSVPGLAAGYGLLTRKPWARVLATVVDVLGLLNFPVGTAIGIYALWVLLQTSAANYFETSPDGLRQSAGAWRDRRCACVIHHLIGQWTALAMATLKTKVDDVLGQKRTAVAVPKTTRVTTP
jgi:hypothetical protein